ncbi:ABC transporter family substrate-binding protein [Nocardioides sp.]|uniref:ABC transporter family substrate-binding protein n=1 Tax=Nocardioides sp. TaxID=35761 RepID=UPI0027347CEA|nr:ABC transporter family substrate-binding protein [Nocardioides sp.]MDP3890343.1 ABC transporter family substrate-binding protein [Nocardioides sp.]
MKIRKFTAAATATALALALAACSPAADEDEDGDGGTAAGTSVTVGWNQPFYSYNDDTSNGNATANAIIKYMMTSSFNYYDADQELVPDESFGSYEKLSDDPLTVKYTFAEGVEWSDGTPVDAADLLLTWAAQGGQLNTIDDGDVERDPDTNVPELGSGVYFDSSSAGLNLVTETPEIGDDGKSLTLVYDEPFADWEVAIDVGVPAHVTAAQALDIEDPQEAKDAFIAAVNDRDEEALSKIAAFWNSGYDYGSLPDDESLYLSNGAYLMTDFVENQYITLKANEDYAGDRAANIETVTVRWNEDPLAQVQALENGELDLFGPQATTDVLQAVEAIDGVEVESGVEGTYEHVDLVFDNGGPFDPKTYGGDEETAKQVRQAFMHAIPRQEVIDKLITPLQEDAEVRDSFLITPGSPGYDEMVEQNGSSEYAEQDIDRAKQLLEDAGVDTPIDVRMMFAEGNVRRENEFAIYQPALKEAGFNLIDRRNVDWGSKLGDGTYDAVFFGWQSTSTAVTESQPTYGTGGLNNLIGYSNEEVDALFDELKVTTDPDEQLRIQIEIEKILFEDAIGITVFQFPAVAAWNTSRITNVEPAPLSPTIFHGFWNWEVPS